VKFEFRKIYLMTFESRNKERFDVIQQEGTQPQCIRNHYHTDDKGNWAGGIPEIIDSFPSTMSSVFILAI